jgi:hypothetical protein
MGSFPLFISSLSPYRIIFAAFACLIAAIPLGLFNPLDRLVFQNSGSGTISKGETLGISVGENIDTATARLRELGLVGPTDIEKANGTFFTRRGLPALGISYHFTDMSWRGGVVQIICIDGQHISAISWEFCPTCP